MLQTEIIPRFHEKNCYVCGSSDIEMLCHHCQRAMCDQHGSNIIPKARKYHRINNREYSFFRLPIDQSKINKDEQIQTGNHCHYCNHYITTYEPVCIGLVLIGIFITVYSSLLIHPKSLAIELWRVGIILGGIGFFCLVIEPLRRFYLERKYSPDLPVWGRFLIVAATEHINGSAEILADGKYRIRSRHARGIFTINLQMAYHDQKRLEKYRRKYFFKHQDINFDAGSLVLSGVNNVKFNNQQENPIRITGSIKNTTLTNKKGPSRDKLWQYKQDYTFKSNHNESSSFPVQIIPTLISEGDDDWALALYVQVTPKDGTSILIPPVVKELRIHIHSTKVKKDLNIATNIESLDPVARTANFETQGPKIIVWQNISLLKKTSADPYHNSFYIRFANSPKIVPHILIKGRLRISFNGNISGLKHVVSFSPLGSRETNGREKIEQYTEVTLKFQFNLVGLNMRKIFTDMHSIYHPTAIPGNEMITRVVNAMNDKRMYVQRVVENPPQTEPTDANITNRMWIIAGRRYEEARPIDFRVVAIGHERDQGSNLPIDGNTKFEITTQCTIINNDINEELSLLREDIVNILEDVPKLHIELTKRDLRVGQRVTISGFIVNNGEKTTNSIEIQAMGPSIDSPNSTTVDELSPEDQKEFELNILPIESGDITIILTAVSGDDYGLLPAYKKAFMVHVDENPTIFSQQTNFYGSTPGPIHTGTGNINQNQL